MMNLDLIIHTDADNTGVTVSRHGAGRLPGRQKLQARDERVVRARHRLQQLQAVADEDGDRARVHGADGQEPAVVTHG